MTSLEKSAIIYLLVGYVNEFCAINIISPERNKKALYDVGFVYLPLISSLYVNIFVLSVVILFAIKWMMKNPIILQKFLNIVSFLFILRVFAFTITVVPPTLPDCFCRQPGEPIIWLFLYHNRSCLDFMFSGHAVHITLVYLFTLFYSNSRKEIILGSVLILPGLLLIIASRLHYTVDVFIGTILANFAFFLFRKQIYR